MSLKSVHADMLIIKNTASTNTKISLLTDMLKNDTFRTVITLMYDDSLHYKVNKMPKRISLVSGKSRQLGATFTANTHNTVLFSFLNKLAEQKGTSNEDKLKLCRLASIDQETYDVVTRIINKDAKCGIGGKSINKACPGLLFLMPYCRCSTEKNKMHNIDYEGYGAIGQEKADGMFDNIIVDKKGGILFRSRNGNIVHQLDHLKKFLRKMPTKYYDTVYMGELLIMVNGEILPRKTGNGILNSCLQNTADPNLARQAIIKLWDAVPQKDFWAGRSEIAYKYRLGRVSKFVKDMNLKQLFEHAGDSFLISKIESKLLHSLEEAQTFYKRKRKEGKEGAIIKNIHAKWKDHTSPDQVKMKNVSDAELRIVSWRFGKEDTRFRDCMGSVQLASDDGLIQVSVSGFKDDERLLDWSERVGKVATLEFEGLITDKSRKGIYSLYLPRNLEMRPDRSDTDTLKSLKKR